MKTTDSLSVRKAVTPRCSGKDWLLVVIAAFGFSVIAVERPGYAGPRPTLRVLKNSELQITGIRRLATTEDAPMSEIEIRWTTLTPRPATIDGFDAALEVHYSDGLTSLVTSGGIKASSRAVVLRVPTHSRPGRGALLKEFKGTIKARIKSSSSFSLSRECGGQLQILDQSDSDRGTVNHPEVSIHEARIGSRGAVDVKWTASAPRNITITAFNVNVDAVLKDGRFVSGSAAARGWSRHVKLLIERPDDSPVACMKVSLITWFFSIETKTAVKEGTFE
jgi:hypothetical protein